MSDSLQRAAPHVLRVCLFVLLCGALWYAQGSLGVDLDPVALREVETAWSLPWLATYFLFWIVANSILWPTLVGGVLYGWSAGTAMAVVGALVAAAIQLTVVRSFLRAPAEAWFGERLKPIQQALESQGPAILVVWRVLWLPLPLLTVATALTRIPLWQYVISVLAMVPGMIALTLMADGLVMHGPWEMPLERWGIFAATFGLSMALWLLAQHRWPVLRLRRPSLAKAS
ncbi:MAG: VTT domain-containing protein [Myxococcales bacterium]|nr:VTT domain-containing protein [Myxococcales bacterium]